MSLLKKQTNKQNASSIFLVIYILSLTSLYHLCNSFLNFVISMKCQGFLFGGVVVFLFDFPPLPIVIPILDVKYLEISIHLKELHGSLKNTFFSYAVYHTEHFHFICLNELSCLMLLLWGGEKLLLTTTAIYIRLLKKKI